MSEGSVVTSPADFSELLRDNRKEYFVEDLRPVKSIERDPLLNPERLKDSGHRQEQILVQLSNLRQGLMMKQREVELGLTPSSLIL